MAKGQVEYLSKREQQIMELAYAKGRITAKDLEAELPGTLSNSSVRTFLRILEDKGELTHVEEEGRYVYLPAKPAQAAAKNALGKLLSTFFGGSRTALMATLLSDTESDLSKEELAELRAMIEEAKEKP